MKETYNLTKMNDKLISNRYKVCILKTTKNQVNDDTDNENKSLKKSIDDKILLSTYKKTKEVAACLPKSISKSNYIFKEEFYK